MTEQRPLPKLSPAQEKAYRLMHDGNGPLYAGHDVRKGTRYLTSAKTLHSLARLGLAKVSTPQNPNTGGTYTVAEPVEEKS